MSFIKKISTALFLHQSHFLRLNKHRCKFIIVWFVVQTGLLGFVELRLIFALFFCNVLVSTTFSLLQDSMRSQHVYCGIVLF